MIWQQMIWHACNLMYVYMLHVNIWNSHDYPCYLACEHMSVLVTCMIMDDMMRVLLASIRGVHVQSWFFSIRTKVVISGYVNFHYIREVFFSNFLINTLKYYWPFLVYLIWPLDDMSLEWCVYVWNDVVSIS